MDKNKYVRPSWDDYFLEIMRTVGRRSTCDRGRTASLIVKDRQILATGYAGAPSGLPHCDEVGHLMKTVINEDGSQSNHCMRTVHAEQNAICQAAKKGVAIEGATVYVGMTPCRTCAMLLINCGIKRIYCEKKYHAGNESEEMFKKAGIELSYKYDEVQEYQNQK
ncbi:cytidine/deoxycytidylate deaminase family protein [Candidatus Shapirobacteria bacterium]|nr:cytidine/deoxycytidylate deaminase family protein [Candidatus Shapirobacteria bacterium]HQI13185.1 cytidine/deoxycytidylate deaminase family protein [Candidatus Woesebacteria bacterium]